MSEKIGRFRSEVHVGIIPVILANNFVFSKKNIIFVENKNSMADKKISQLPILTDIVGDESIPVAYGGENYSVNMSTLKKYAQNPPPLPYTLEFVKDVDYDISPQTVHLDVRGGTIEERAKLTVYLMRNLAKKKHKNGPGSDHRGEYHYTTGWRHPRHESPTDEDYHETEWPYGSGYKRYFEIFTADAFERFVYFRGDNGSGKPKIVINGVELLYSNTEQLFYTSRPINTWGFALYLGNTRVSNICPVKITISGNATVEDGISKMKIYAYPG